MIIFLTRILQLQIEEDRGLSKNDKDQLFFIPLLY